MPDSTYQGSPNDRECRESIRAEPEWADIEASKAWLEERYPLLDDVSLGSPLFLYMKACVKDPGHMLGRDPIFLASMLSFHESVRYSRETNLTVGFDPKQEKLYPDYGFPDQNRVPEPDWSDMEVSRTWLEQLYPLGRSCIGSPLYRYMQACRESRHPMSRPTTYLGSMLTDSEWRRFCRGYPNSVRLRHGDKPNPVILYPEYDDRIWPLLGPVPQPPEIDKLFSPGRPHTKSLPPPAANPPMFADSYPPHLRRQSASGSPSKKRKGDVRADASPDQPANKRRLKRSDLRGGVVMPAKPLHPYKGYTGPRQTSILGSMPPPPSPQRKAESAKSRAGATGLDQPRNNGEEGSIRRQDTIDVTRTLPRLTHGLIEARNDSRVLDLNRQSTEMQTADPARQNDGSVETPNASDSVQAGGVFNNMPAHAHNSPMLSRTKQQDGEEAYLEEKSEIGDLGHQRHGQHKENEPTVQNDNNVAHEPANKNPAHLRPDPQSGNLAQVEEDPDVMDIDSDILGHQTSASPNNIPPADPSRKRGIEDVEEEQPISSSSKKRRASPDTSGDDPLISSPTRELPLADYPRNSTIEDMEDILPASFPSKNNLLSTYSGDDESPTSSAFTETQPADPSDKRIIEEVEDAPPTTSSKRKRTPPNSGGNELAPSSPFDPPEMSTPTSFPYLDKRLMESRTRGEIPDLAPLRQPSYENPTRLIPRPKDIEGPDLLSGPQSDSTGGRRSSEKTNTNDLPTANLGDHDASLIGGGETQRSAHDIPVSLDLESRDDNHVDVEENPDHMGIDFEHRKDQTSTNFKPITGDRTVQRAISVVIPLQTWQRQLAEDLELSPDDDTTMVPVIQNKRKGERKPGTQGRKGPQSKPQREQGQSQPLTSVRKNRKSKPERERQAYVGRLRSGVGGRKHKKPSKCFIAA